MNRPYLIDDEKKQQFAGIVTLNYLYESQRQLARPLQGNDALLQGTLSWLEGRGHVDGSDSEFYRLTTSGSDAVACYRAHYREFLRTFDIYAFVDLEEAEFAFERFFEFDEEEAWEEYIEQECWDDLRIAVAELKKIDPVEIVFLSFVTEGLFDDTDNWQRDLLDDELWTEVQELCNCSVAIEDLGYQDPEDGKVEGVEVLQDIIREGAELNLELKALEEELSGDEPMGEDDRDADEEEIDAETYFLPYYEPYYVAPIWETSWAL